MNAAIRGAVRTALSAGCRVQGIYRGYEGLLEADMEELFWKSVGGIVNRGGTILKTARCPGFHQKEQQEKAAKILRDRGIDGLIVIGGDGSMAGAASLEALGTATAVVPGTIDNDMCGTEETIGYDTAVNTALEAMNRIRDTAASHNRAAVIEVMGRHSGNIALAAGLAGGAEFTLVPEIPFDRKKIAARLTDMMKEGRTNCLLVCAEGAADGRELADWLKKETDIDLCVTILGYIQRGGAPSARDAMLGALLGAAAAENLLAGKHGFLAGMKGGRKCVVSYADAFSEKKEFRKEDHALAMRIGAGL